VKSASPPQFKPAFIDNRKQSQQLLVADKQAVNKILKQASEPDRKVGVRDSNDLNNG
jgi:hypothetical protein